MSFTTSKITDLAKIDRMLAKTQLELSNIDNKLLNLAYERNQMDLHEEQTQLAITGIQAELDSANITLATLQEGEAKANTQDRVTRLSYQLFLANNRLGRYGGEAMVNNEFDQIKYTALSADMSVFITALQTRRAEIAAAV